VNKQRRTWFPPFLVIGGFMLMLAAGLFPRQAEAAVSIECEILVEDDDALMPGQAPFAVVGSNVEEDGEGVEGADPVVAWPGAGDPLIVYIDPISGASGVQVTIYGYNFTGVTSVTLTSGTETVVVPPDSITLAGVDDAGVPDGYDEIVFTTPAPPVATGGVTDVTVSNTTGGTGTLSGGFFYIIPSPYPGLPGSSTVTWVEVIVSTNILDGFQAVLDEFVAEYSVEPTPEELLDLFRGYLDSVFHSVTLWVDGYSEGEEENGFFSGDDRPLEPLLDSNDNGAIDDSENLAAEVYENFIPGSRARVFSFARNPGLGAMLRAAATHENVNADPPVTPPPDMLLPYSVPVGGADETMDQIVYRFACAWPDHNVVQSSGRTGSGFVDIGSGFEVPRIAWPTENPALNVTGRVSAHVSNQYIGGSGDGEEDSELFIGNDYFVTFQPGCGYPANAVLNFRIVPETPAGQLPGIQTDPPPPEDAAFEGCESESSIGGAEGTNYIVNIVPMNYTTDEEQQYSPPGVKTRMRPDVVGTPEEELYRPGSLPRIIQMEYPTAVLGIHAHGGDPSDIATAVFPNRITVTFTDIGGGAQFGRPLASVFAGDGDFNPWFGLDDMERQHGYRGVDFYRDSDNDGDLNPESDDVYASDPLIIQGIANAWEPYYFIQNPGKGVAPWFRDDPEWTIVLNLTNRVIYRSPRVPDRDPEPMDDSNFADFALESPIGADDTPDFFVAIQLDSGYADTPGAPRIGDGTGIKYGADFRVYVKPELVVGDSDSDGMPDDWEMSYGLDPFDSADASEDPDDDGYDNLEEYHGNSNPQDVGSVPAPPDDGAYEGLDDMARRGGLDQFPGGMIFSVQEEAAGGLGCETSNTTMAERQAPPQHAVMQTHNYVINVADGSNPFTVRGKMETVPFFNEADLTGAGGPRSPFFREPPTFFGPDADPPLSDFTWWIDVTEWPPLTLLEEHNFLEDAIGHRLMAQRIDSLSEPTCVLGLNVVNTPDTVTLANNNLKVARIECYIVSEDHRGTTGFQPGDLLAVADDGLGDTGISLWQDAGSNGWFDEDDDTQLPLMIAEIGTVPEPINMDGIDQGTPDLWGYRVILEPVTAFNVPIDDIGDNEGDDLYIAVQTSNAISYKDKIEVVIPHSGITFLPTGNSAPSGTLRYARDLPLPLPIEVGDAHPRSDDNRYFFVSQLLANVPTQLNSLTRPDYDSDADGVADAQGIGPLEQVPVIGLDVATLNQDAEVYLEYLVVEFYNQGEDGDGDGIPDDENFSPGVDLLPFAASDDLAFESFDSPRDIGTVTVTTWHFGEGKYMLVGEPLVDLETTDINPATGEPLIVTLNAPFTGLLADIVAGPGDTVISGERLAWLAHVGSGIALYRDNDDHPNNRNGKFDPPRLLRDPNGLPYFDYIDVPVVFDDPPDLVGVSGEPPIQVRMAFSSPGTDNWEGTVDPINEPTPTPLEDQITEWAGYEDGRFGRQLVPTTFGRRENGNFIQGHPDAGDDFFVVIRTSEAIEENDNFSAGIVSWGPDTPTGVDADTFTAPPAPWQSSDEYEKFEQSPWGSRGVGYIEILSPDTPPEPRAYTNLGGFDFLRTRATVQAETDMLYTTTETIPVAPPTGGGGQPGFEGQLSLEGGGGGGGGCFIATAAYGTRYEEHVVALVKFRDKYLLTSAGGTWLVKRYYSLSPRVAEFIARHEIVRAVVRQIIRPAAAIARLCLMTSAAGKIAILFGSALGLAALMTARRKWRSVRV